MRNVSEAFKQAIKEYGRQIDVIIEYTEDGIEKMLDVNNLFSVTPIVKANLLKSVMKQLDFESSVKVPKDTWINVRFGVLIEKGLTVQEVHQMRVDRLNSTEVRMLQSFEYINLGKYLVAEEPEYNADTLSYSHKCFDKMIYAMQDYEPLNIVYPIKIKKFLYALANKLKISVANSTFYNQDRMIRNELYEGLGYTYRDVLDEIAQATGSIICINDNDKLEVRYLNNTNETIDEDILKDVNVTMKEKYGAINTIVLSRSAGADNIYYPETLPENPIEIKISDNQIMNWNDRSDYLPELYQALNGIEYYVNDFKSTGITYLEVGDKYNIQIGENTYNCVLLNDEIDITQGLEEQIYTDIPEQSQTDYKKADKTDQKINQTNLTVDKQNQQINATITRVENNEENISNLLIDVDGIHTEVSKKVGENEIISKINQSAEAVSIDASKISLNGKTINLTSDNIIIKSTNFNVDKNGNVSCSNATLSGEITATGGTIGGFEVIRERLRSTNKKVGMSSSTWAGDPAFWAGNIDPWENPNWRTTTPFLVTNQGGLIARDAEISGNINATNGKVGNFTIENGNITGDDQSSGAYIRIDPYQMVFQKREGSTIYSLGQISVFDTNTHINFIRTDGNSSKLYVNEITADAYNYFSLKERKKNFEKYNNALEVLKDIDIYKYNFKTEKDGTKKHIGFVIGKDFKYSEEVTSKNNDGVDIYSFVSLCCQAIKELQEEIEELKKKGDIE